MVFYSAYLFNRTDQEIKKFIRDNIDPQYLLPSEIPAPDVYYLKILMMIRGGIIEDKSGNGRNLVIAINPNITDSYIGDGAIIGRNKFHSSYTLV